MTTSENIETILELTTIQKKKLRGLGHHLEPVVYVGKEGVSKPLQQSLAAALKARELVKIKLGQNCPIERTVAGEQLAQISEAALVQVIGRMVLLYKPNPDLPQARRIEL
jgi:RNA-binding protein